jgi:serine/threonine-protein kinase
MGKVLLSRQRSLGRDVAVKVARGDASLGTVQALIHEARTTGALEHPGIIPVYALASDVAGRPALVMKRVDGVSWSRLLHDPNDPAWDRIRHRGLDELEAHIDILTHVCNAIAFAHSKGVLHRDIKPANVLIGEFGEVYVADWGVAARKAELQRPDQKPALVGTPVYLAPEMVAGDDTQMDERTDVFLLGSTLFEVLAGKPPFGGPDLRAVLLASWEGRSEPIPASAPPELADICRQAMAIAPAQRFQSATELRDALMGWVRHRGSVALARAAQERLDQLIGLLRSGSKDRAEIVPLASECRFGFTQALREWPHNDLAKEGLRDALEATARFEISQGNLEVATALCRELGSVPPDLAASLRHLEERQRERARRDARLDHLAQELDPEVSRRERAWFFVALGLMVVVMVGALELDTPVRAWLRSLGKWLLPMTFAGYLISYCTLIFVGRRSLLATRLNRRIAGVVAIVILGPLLNRTTGTLLGATMQQMVVGDLILSAAVCTTAALMLHWGFWLSTLTYLLAATGVFFWPEHEALIYGGAAVLGIFGVTRTRWRNELWFSDKDG